MRLWRAVDSLVRSTVDAQGMSHVSLTGLDVLGLAHQPRPTAGDRGRHSWNRW
jgi:hypothetical protein